jgi:hypothetical protein
MGSTFSPSKFWLRGLVTYSNAIACNTLLDCNQSLCPNSGHVLLPMPMKPAASLPGLDNRALIGDADLLPRQAMRTELFDVRAK